eukprot:403331167
MEQQLVRKDNQTVKTLEIDKNNVKSVALDQYLSSLYATSPIFVGMPMMRFDDEKRISWTKVMSDVVNYYAPDIPYNYLQQKVRGSSQQSQRFQNTLISSVNFALKKKVKINSNTGQIKNPKSQADITGSSNQNTPIILARAGQFNPRTAVMKILKHKKREQIQSAKSDSSMIRNLNQTFEMIEQRDIQVRRHSCQCKGFCGKILQQHKGDQIVVKHSNRPPQLLKVSTTAQNSPNRLSATQRVRPLISPRKFSVIHKNQSPLLDSPLKRPKKQLANQSPIGQNQPIVNNQKKLVKKESLDESSNDEEDSQDSNSSQRQGTDITVDTAELYKLKDIYLKKEIEKKQREKMLRHKKYELYKLQPTKLLNLELLKRTSSHRTITLFNTLSTPQSLQISNLQQNQAQMSSQKQSQIISVFDQESQGIDDLKNITKSKKIIEGYPQRTQSPYKLTTKIIKQRPSTSNIKSLFPIKDEKTESTTLQRNIKTSQSKIRSLKKSLFSQSENFKTLFSPKSSMHRTQKSAEINFLGYNNQQGSQSIKSMLFNNIYQQNLRQTSQFGPISKSKQKLLQHVEIGQIYQQN